MRLCLESLAQQADSIAMEAEVTDGKTRKEIEYEVFARLSDPQALERAHKKIHQEQWSLRLEDGRGTLRVRKCLEDNQIQYEQTLKLNLSGEGGVKSALENTLVCTVDFYNVFAALSAHGQVKDRYVYPIEGQDHVWEADRFYTKEGTPHEVIKLDLEVAAPLEQLPALPEGFEPLITRQKGERTQEEIAQLTQWQAQWAHASQESTQVSAASA